MADDGGIWIKAESTAASASAYVKTSNGWEEVSGGAGFQPGSPEAPDLDPSAVGPLIEFGAPPHMGHSPVIAYGATIDPPGPVLTVDVADPLLGGEISITGTVLGETYVVSVYAINTQGRGPAASTDPWEAVSAFNDADGGAELTIDDYWNDGSNEKWKVHWFTQIGLNKLKVKDNPQPFRVLTVGGGGKGGSGGGGGGGGGMAREYNDESLPAGTTHDLYVGNSGAQTYVRIRAEGSNGSGSSSVKYTAQAGGVGGHRDGHGNSVGGTGGGGGIDGNGGYGSNGGKNGGFGGSSRGGGGGGNTSDGSYGGNGASDGAGGDGFKSNLLGSEVWYGGGGGGGRLYGQAAYPDGGPGGVGGGGHGGSAADNAENGVSGRGGGGGGGGVDYSATPMIGKEGGSGCVIVAYQIGFSTKIAGERARQQREIQALAAADAYAQGQVDTHEVYSAVSEPEE